MPLWDRIPRLDRQKGYQGVTVNSMTFWTLAVPDATIDYAVLATTDFGSDEGKVLQVANSGGTICYVEGNYTAGCVILGRGYSAILDLSDHYPRDSAGRAMIDGHTLIRELTVRHRNTGKYTIKIVPDASKWRTKETTFEAGSNDIQTSGSSRSFVGLTNDVMTMRIQEDGPKPLTIASVVVEADYTDL
jgi:hypothetical protein